VPGPRILVVDGNVADVRARQVALVGEDSGAGYVKMLRRLLPDLDCDIIRPADGQPELPAGVGIGSYDGVAVTGSALNVYNGGASVDRQVDVAKAVFAAGVPFFGSCWGLQIAVTAAGGVVRKNPRGREFGFARRILLTDAGTAHPLFAGKPRVFEAPTIHRDEIQSLPRGALTLASNDMGLQAAAFTHGQATFWGVQYHPEYEFADIAAAAERYGRVLVEEGMFSDEPALHEFVADLRRLQLDPTNGALAWKHGLGPAITDERTRLLELRNWIEQQVVPRARQRA
jgi:GMP synthase (glutamine-hydrolysing)